MMFKTMISVTSLATIVLLGTAQADDEVSDSRFALTGKVGTLGLGADLTYRLSNKVNARFNINGGSVEADGEEDDVNYLGNLDAQTVGGLVDYHPMASGLRITAGLYNNSNELDLNATGTGNTDVDIGDRTYDLTGASLNANVGFDSVAPYVGIGWGNAVKMGSKWRFSVDAGVLFQGSPEARLTGSGIATDTTNGGNTSVDLATDPAFNAELTKEEQNLNDDLKDFKAYPVISAGLSYRF